MCVLFASVAVLLLPVEAIVKPLKSEGNYLAMLILRASLCVIRATQSLLQNKIWVNPEESLNRRDKGIRHASQLLFLLLLLFFFFLLWLAINGYHVQVQVTKVNHIIKATESCAKFEVLQS
jgi:hypothetical protein